jgi:lipopolysaccharide/colanic/teichoic acid biosynthesis glycosyltransferase
MLAEPCAVPTGPWQATIGAGRFPFWKRALDIGLGTVALVSTLPVVLIVAAAIKLCDGGPVLFWQRRVGQRGREFWFPKLRSMHLGADELHPTLLARNMHRASITFKMQDDPRVTWIGRYIRVLSVDELPQLWCVVNGDMSLVGPRPPLPSEVRQYAPGHLRRLDARPGITGLWQISGRSIVPFDGQVLLDVEYIERRSLWLDLEILLRTVPAVLSCRGAW